MTRQPAKCCCCAPLRPGLLAWAYIKLVLALTSIGVYFYFMGNELRYVAYNFNDISIYRSPDLFLLELLWPLAVCLLYLVFTIIFIIGVHRENIKLLLVFLVYSIFEVLLGSAAAGWQMYNLVDFLSFYRFQNPEEYHRILVHCLTGPLLYSPILLIVFNMLLPMYFIVLIKSEVQRLKISRGETRVVLDKPVVKEEDGRYDFVYSNQTPDLRKPLFPVGELERLRQQLGVKNV